MTREDIQKLTDDYAKTLNTRKPQPAATATDSDFGQSERTEAAFNDLRRITVIHSVQSSIKQFLTSRNESIRKQKEKQKEKEKAMQNPLVSKPFWF
jgi:hypothetical protein